MTIPLDNLYEYIFSLASKRNKNLMMYRFDPHGSKSIKNLKCCSYTNDIHVKSKNMTESKIGFHYKLLFFYDQEPLNFNLYDQELHNEKREIFDDLETGVDYSLYRKSLQKRNLAGHPYVPLSLYDKKLLVHSEKNSRELEKYEKNGFLGIYYWSHAFIALDWYRFAKHDPNLNYDDLKSFHKDFNIYCRGWTGTREYRLKFLSKLILHNIDKVSNIFFNEYNENKKFSDHIFTNAKWKISTHENKIIEDIDCIKNKNSDPALSATYSHSNYQNSAIDIVLETVFDQEKIQLTEKILRPIACGKPFILVSEKGSLEYLKSYGFKTFDGLIDERYDQFACPKKRLNSIIELMKWISSLEHGKKNQLFFEMHKIADFNKKWFFSNQFFNTINEELKDNLYHGISMLDNPEYQTAKEIKLFYRAYRRYRKYFLNDKKILADIDMVLKETPDRLEESIKVLKTL